MQKHQSFSDRHAYKPDAPEITVREDAPENLRYYVMGFAQQLGLSAHDCRSTICHILREVPDSNNWSAGNVQSEAEWLISKCPWYQVYDIAEAFYRDLERQGRAEEYAALFNEFCIEKGIGWQLLGGQIVTRGPEAFEAVVRDSLAHLQASRLPTAASELQEAYRDLSKRPAPDITGGVQHALASLEIVARQVSNLPNETLGSIVKLAPQLFPQPLDDIVKKAWGYGSEKGRHLREGHVPTFNEAMLIVGLAASLSAFLKRGDMIG